MHLNTFETKNTYPVALKKRRKLNEFTPLSIIVLVIQFAITSIKHNGILLKKSINID